MKIRDTLRGALRRVAGPSFLKLQWPLRRPPTALVASSAEPARRTVPLPSIFTPGAPTLLRAGVMPKPTPANLRRFAETPIARKAINTIKDRIAGMAWRIQPRRGRSPQETPASGDYARDGFTMLPSAAERIAALTLNFEQPNPEDSFRSFIEQVLEDVLVGGFGAIELDLSGDPEQPLLMWPVDGASIRIRTDWDGSPTSPHYVQVTAPFTPAQEITSGRRRAVVYPAERAHLYSVWAGEVGGCVRDHPRIPVRPSLRLASWPATAWCNTRSGCRT